MRYFNVLFSLQYPVSRGNCQKGVIVGNYRSRERKKEKEKSEICLLLSSSRSCTYYETVKELYRVIACPAYSVVACSIAFYFPLICRCGQADKSVIKAPQTNATNVRNGHIN